MPSSFLGWEVFLWEEYWPLFLKGAWVSLYIAAAGTAIGFLLGLLVAILRTAPRSRTDKPARKLLLGVGRFLTSAYVSVLRGTPMMVQAMVIYYGLIQYAHLQLPVTLASVLIVGLNTGAYMAEILRAGIESVDPGQNEAAVSIGMTHWQTMRCVILPQAVRNSLPSVGNELITNVKDSSVLNVIAVSELFFVAKSASGTYLRYFEVYILVAVLYFILTSILTAVLSRVEKRMAGPENFALAASGRKERKA